MSPPRKIRKTDEAGMKKPEPEGVIRFEVDNVSTMKKGDYEHSPGVEVKGMSWRMKVSRGGEYLDVELKSMHSQLTSWNVKVNAECTLINHDSSKSVTKTESCVVSAKKMDVCLYGMTKWKKVIDKKKGFINDDKITVEIRFFVSNMKGVRIFPHFDFTDPNDPRHDITFVIDGEKLYASKQLLASHSPFFNTMFYGDFAEKNQKEIVMNDIDREEFLGMLHVIYPSHKKITDKSAEHLLTLGDRFQIMSVMDRVEEYLAFHSTLTFQEKLTFADTYRLCGLTACIADKNRRGIIRIQKSSFYNDLSDATKKELENSDFSQGGRPVSAPDGFIRFVVENVTELDDDDDESSDDEDNDNISETRFSQQVEVKGLPWRLGVYRNYGDLCVTLPAMFHQPTPWTIEVKMECILIDTKNRENFVGCSSDCSPRLLSNTSKKFHLPMWIFEEIIDPEEGFIKDDKITVEARFWLNMKGIKTPTIIDFADPNNPIHDVVLIIEGEKIYASKQILAIYSPVFYDMFYGELAEKDKEEFELKDVNREHFIDILHVIYPSNKVITDEIAQRLLRLGDEFQIEFVKERAEVALIKGDLNEMERLRIAEQYKLYGLMKKALSEFETTQDFVDVKESSFYDDLSEATKVELFERHLDIVK